LVGLLVDHVGEQLRHSLVRFIVAPRLERLAGGVFSDGCRIKTGSASSSTDVSAYSAFEEQSRETAVLFSVRTASMKSLLMVEPTSPWLLSLGGVNRPAVNRCYRTKG